MENGEMKNAEMKNADRKKEHHGYEEIIKLESLWGEKLRRYAELLASYAAARLTGSRDVEELYNLHVRDSLYSVPLLPKAGKVIDVGSGGGLPGMVWALCRPDLSVTLLDSARKKCRALSEMAKELKLENVSVIWGRCEEHALVARETYALVEARALAHTGVLAEYLSPLAAPGGRLLAFKGPKGLEELEELTEAGNKWDELALSSPDLIPYGPQDRSYFFVIWKKKAPCPLTYPRKPGLALSKSWWSVKVS
jgi:16S rRNA (guanine527-N7)-methyltransferase